MRNLIAESIVAHNLSPVAANTGASIEHKGRTVFETQTGQSNIIRVVEIPRSPNCPISACPSAPNCTTTPVINRSFQLAPTEDKICLVVYALFQFDSVYRVDISSCICALRFKFRVNFQIYSLDVWQIAHGSEHRNHGLLIKRLQFLAIGQRSNTPIRGTKVLRGVDNDVVVMPTEKIQPPVRTNYPQTSWFDACGRASLIRQR
jgi:hypothetical protein